MTESLIVAISTENANLENIRSAIALQTGDENPFFCPRIIEGKPYKGHAHIFPPFGAKEASITPVELK